MCGLWLVGLKQQRTVGGRVIKYNYTGRSDWLVGASVNQGESSQTHGGSLKYRNRTLTGQSAGLGPLC